MAVALHDAFRDSVPKSFARGPISNRRSAILRASKHWALFPADTHIGGRPLITRDHPRHSPISIVKRVDANERVMQPRCEGVWCYTDDIHRVIQITLRSRMLEDTKEEPSAH